jgi:hypothetical protein
MLSVGGVFLSDVRDMLSLRLKSRSMEVSGAAGDARRASPRVNAILLAVAAERVVVVVAKALRHGHVIRWYLGPHFGHQRLLQLLRCRERRIRVSVLGGEVREDLFVRSGAG